MASYSIESSGERKHMAPHDENEIQQLTSEEHLTADRTQENFAGIGHSGYVWISPFELSDHISCIASENAQTNQHDDSRDQSQ